jgi:perosamine synthetase
MSKNYPIARPSITERERENVDKAISSGWISSAGPYVEEFEARFSAMCGAKYGVAVSNGTVALHLALRAIGVKSDDEVIVPDLSFIATANAVLMAGATPVFCDIDPETLCIDPNEISNKLTSRTKAIIPVHLYGHPADMDAINSVAKEHGLVVIEDAAEAHGAVVRGRRVGGIGDCATFSFYANKNITTGEGGMITTNDLATAERCRFLRDHAMNKDRRYWHEELGYNYRLTNLQAAIGCAQLDRFDDLSSAKAQIFQWYKNELGNLRQVRLNRTASWAINSYWLICCEFPEFTEAERNSIMISLGKEGIDSRPYFYPMSDMPYYQTAHTPIAHKIAKIGINLPTFIGLTREDVGYICSQVRKSILN